MMDKLESQICKQIEEYKKYCLEYKNFTEQTAHNTFWTINNFASFSGVVSAAEITSTSINRWLDDQIACGCSGRTVNSRRKQLLPMINYFSDKKYCSRIDKSSLSRYVENPPRQIFYTSEQIDEVLTICDQMQWLLIKIAFDTGMRLSELTNLRLSEINDRRLTYIGKGRKLRESYISPEARTALSEWIVNNNIVDFVWENKHSGLPYHKNSIRDKMATPFLAAGFTDFYPHALRHSFGTDGQRNGAGILELRDMLGHSRLETTERYLHGIEGRLEEVFDKYKFNKNNIQKNDAEYVINFLKNIAKELAV